MPTVTVKRDILFKKIGQEFTDEEFDKLCFEFGIELDDIVEDLHPKNVEYKIDIPANRYDLLCVEGIATALAVFLNKRSVPRYSKMLPAKPIVTTVSPSTAPLRPYVVTAVLRNMNITHEAYDSLIDLQEKLHHNICRKRTLVAIGIHDLDTLAPPFTYSCEPPQEIKFKPLNQMKEFRADELMEFYEKDTHLKPYLHIIKNEPLYPVIKDSKGVVLSLPPIINGDHSKVTTATKNIFIECTATDLMKAQVVLDILVTMLSEHLKKPYEAEATQVVYTSGQEETMIYPCLEYKSHSLDVGATNKNVGINIPAQEMATSLSKMGLQSKVLEEGRISVEVPPTRHDILHQCDIIEDVAISYGYGNIVPSLPPTVTVASQFPLNKLSFQLADCMAQAGFTETLTFSLCSLEDEIEKVRKTRQEMEPKLVRIANPKTQDFQVARYSLLPGLLKTIQANKNMPLPLKLFEISDVVQIDEKMDTGTRNSRHFCAVNYNKTPGFEIIHGLLDRFMQVLEVQFQDGYSLRAADDSTYFPGRCAEIVYEGRVIGKLGVLHPKVVENFDLNLPCSAVEIEIEDFV